MYQAGAALPRRIPQRVIVDRSPHCAEDYIEHASAAAPAVTRQGGSAMPDHAYNPLSRRGFEAIAFNAIGRSSEINNRDMYGLTHSTGNSGWSVGMLQWDFGQGNRGVQADEMLRRYQAWVPAGERFTAAQVESLSDRLQTRGQTGNALTKQEESRLEGYLRSDGGRQFVAGLDRMQMDLKWERVGKPLSEIPWLQNLRTRDPSQAAEIVAMTGKLFNQNQTRGQRLIGELQDGPITSEAVRTWIGTQGINGLNENARTAIVSGRDNALAGVRLMNAMEASDGRIGQAWRAQVDAGTTSLGENFNTNLNVQLLDKMFRDPANGQRVLAQVDSNARNSPVTMLGTDESARVTIDRKGELRITSPNGDRFVMTEGGWARAPTRQLSQADEPSVYASTGAIRTADVNPSDAAFRHPGTPDFQRVSNGVRRSGLPADGAENISARLYLEVQRDPLMKRVDAVERGVGADGRESVFAVYMPHGAREPMFNVRVDAEEAARTPASDSLRQAEAFQPTLDASTQNLNREQAQSSVQDQTGPTIGARTL